MITETATSVIQCSTQSEYDAEKHRIQSLPNLQVMPTYNDALLKITFQFVVNR